MRVPSERIQALDQARGLAVLLMICIHLIPVEGDGSALGDCAAVFTGFIWDKCAGIFCVVAGMTWNLQNCSFATTARRALGLAIVGLILWLTIWPTEILTALALMMVCTWPLRRASKTLLAVAILSILGAVPIVGARWFNVGWNDWHVSGLHYGQSLLLASPAETFRYFFYSGNYPLLPWIAYPLLGQLLLPVVRSSAIAAASFIGALITLVGLHAYRSYSDVHWENLPALWMVNASPSTLPYWALEASSAVVVVSALVMMRGRVHRGLLEGLSDLGRASLTHYVLHICLIYWPLAQWWPGEDWPASVGLTAFVAYLAAAISGSQLWFRRWGKQRGPVEQLWSFIR